MKFDTFNPSELEIQVCEAFSALKPELEQKLNGLTILKIQVNLNKDNPEITLSLADNDGDIHTLTVAFIHKPA
jgi:hypothetical protein